MEWMQFILFLVTILGVFVGVFGLFLWNRAEARADARNAAAEMKDFHEAIKDFHGRLCKIEEKQLQFMQEYWRSK